MKRQRERKETGFVYEKTENGKAKEMETMTRRKNGKYRGAGCRITAMIAVMAMVLGCMAAMTVSAGTAGDDAAWLENRSSKTTYEEYVAHDAVSLYGDFNNDNRGDIEDVLLAYLAASGERDPWDVRYSSEDVTPSFRVHGRFEPPCDEWNRVHGRRAANPGYIDCLYEPLALYFRVCAGAECPYDGPDEGVTTTTTTAETTATEPTADDVPTPENTPLWPPITPKWPEVPKPAVPVDESAIENLVLQKINAYRAAEGKEPIIRLEKGSKVSKYRSKQLYYDFAHTSPDGVIYLDEALAAYQYGQYYYKTQDKTYGAYSRAESWEYSNKIFPEHPNGFGSAEDIGVGGSCRSVEEYANDIVELFRSDAPHWEPLMAGDESVRGCAKFAGIGVTIDNFGQYYCCINLFPTDEYE